MPKVVNANLDFRAPMQRLDLGNVKKIIIHHIAHHNATPEDIHRWHLDRGWNGAGYNEYIRKDGTVYIIRGDNVGAHTRGHNAVSYGIALEGNYDVEEEIPHLQYSSLIERIKYHKDRLKTVDILGHGDVQANSCPGKYVNMDKIIVDVENEKIEDIDKAIEILHYKGIFESPEYWKKVLKDGEYVKSEYIKIALLRIVNSIWG